jgi:hypothetical protein
MFDITILGTRQATDITRAQFRQTRRPPQRPRPVG